MRRAPSATVNDNLRRALVRASAVRGSQVRSQRLSWNHTELLHHAQLIELSVDMTPKPEWPSKSIGGLLLIRAM
jgi:hypothetical protein